jgi:DNA helicase-2/ATP-dependent DNA helicase PcrA
VRAEASVAVREPTPEQAAAARAESRSPLLIAAGPGTGKTFTMVERFRWLVMEGGLDASAIMAATFSEAAAAELRERLRTEFGDAVDEAWIGTFHGTCARLLREHAYLIGQARELRVLNDVEQRLLIERLRSQLRSGAEPVVDIEALSALNPDDVTSLLRDGLQFALKLKGRGIRPGQFRDRALEMHAGHDHPANGQLSWQAEQEAIELLHAVYSAYEKRLTASGRRDFDDLILATIEALERHPEFRARCRALFAHILVDEFQDTNRIQLDLIRLLAADGFANVTAVGDAKQSIYGWRDAEIENIRSRFPGRRMPLTHNRRSCQEILDLATDFIRHDPEFEDEPALVADRGSGGRAVIVAMAADSRAEARLLAAEIRRLVEAGTPRPDIAILAHSVKHLPRDFEEELRRQRIPYVTTGGSGFFDREEVKDVLALMRLAVDPMDDGALVRVLQGPVVRVDDAAMYRLAARRFGRRGMRLRDCLEESGAEGYPELAPEVTRRAAVAIEVTDRLGSAKDALSVADVLNRLLEESGYQRHTQLRAEREGPRAMLNLRKVLAMASHFERDSPLAGTLDFVRHLEQIMDAELPIGEAEAGAADAVKLLTVHGAKGLEFPVVFLVNLRPPRARDFERLFFDPDSFGFVMRQWHGDRHPRFKELAPGAASVQLAVQERRRAVYVALTRAADHLYVSAAREEKSADEVSGAEDDHFAEILAWALANPAAASVVEAEQLPLPDLEAAQPPAAETSQLVTAVIDRLDLLEPRSAAGPLAQPGPLELSFSQLHQFEVCPVRYRFQDVWRVPAPPDELLPAAARAVSASELGAAVHSALAAFHSGGGDLIELYEGPPAGLQMLRAYLSHPLAAAPSLGTELEFNLRLGGVRVKGLVDRVCVYEGATALVDYKTNARLDASLVAAYSTQLRLYGLAARSGLLPGGPDPRLMLFDLRRGDVVEVQPDHELAERQIVAAAARISAGDFSLGPQHAQRPCHLCAYRPICPDRR